MKPFQGFDLRQWLWTAAVAGAICPAVLAQTSSQPALQAPARLGPQSARPIQQVAGTTNVQRNNPMRPAAPPQLTVDPNAPKSDIQRQLEIIYEQNGMEAPNMNLQMAPIQPNGGAAGAQPQAGSQQTAQAAPQRVEEQGGNRFTGFFKKLIGGGDSGPKPTPAGRQTPGLSNASAPSPLASPPSAPPAVPPVVDGLFDEVPPQPTAQAPAALPPQSQAQPIQPQQPQYQPRYQPQDRTQYQARPQYQPQYRAGSQPQYQPPAQSRYQTAQPQYRTQQPQYRQPGATQPQYTAQPTYPSRSTIQQPGQPGRLPAAAAAPVAVRQPMLPVTPDSELPPAPPPYTASTTTTAEPTTLGTPAFLPAATTQPQPVAKSDAQRPADQFAEPLKVTKEPVPSVIPRTRIEMAGPRIPAKPAPSDDGPSLALPPTPDRPADLAETRTGTQPATVSSLSDETTTTVASTSADPLGDFDDPFTEMSESEADGKGKPAPQKVAAAPTPAASDDAPALPAPKLTAPEPTVVAEAPIPLPAPAASAVPKIEVSREDGAPVLLPAPLQPAPALADDEMEAEEEEEEEEDPFEAELNDDEPALKTPLPKPAAAPSIAVAAAAPKSQPADDISVELAVPAPLPPSAPKLSNLPPFEVPAPTKAEPAPEAKPAPKLAERVTEPQPLDAPELTPVPQMDLTPETTKAKFDRIRGRSGSVGLKGFCPVKLRDQRELVDAQPAYESMYRGQKYLFSDIESKAKFEQNPTRYAPAAYGADVVALLRDKNVVEGTLDYAAWYKGRLYLFGSQSSHDTFVEKPEDYADGEIND